MKKGAIFDMDGLLFDTERLFREAWLETEQQYHQPHQPAFRPAAAGTNGAGMRAVIQQYYPAVDAEAFAASALASAAKLLQSSLPEKPGMREILSFLRERGVKCALASSSGRQMIEGNLRRAGITDCFDVIVTGQEVAHGKPAPDIFLLAAQRLECAPEDCYVFEDSINGARAGVAAGCAAVMIPDLTAPTEDLRADCAGIYASLLEARDALAEGRL